MSTTVSDTRIKSIDTLESPDCIRSQYPINEQQKGVVTSCRKQIEEVLDGKSHKLILVMGPCSIHNTTEAIDYAHFIKKIIDRYSDNLIIIMRTYFAKPRTTVGWKGLIYDPDLDGSYKIHQGIPKARKVLLDILSLGVPCSMEHLDTISPQYFDDLISKNGRLDNLLSTSLNIANLDKLKTYFREIQSQKPNKRVFVNPNNLLPFIYGYTINEEDLDLYGMQYTQNIICERLGGEGNVITYTPPRNQGFTLPNEKFFTCLCDAPEPEIPTSCEELGCPEGFQCLNGECSPIPDPTQGCRARPYDGWIKAKNNWDYFYNRS